jgi:hypothetical protein
MPTDLGVINDYSFGELDSGSRINVFSMYLIVESIFMQYVVLVRNTILRLLFFFYNYILINIIISIKYDYLDGRFIII